MISLASLGDVLGCDSKLTDAPTRLGWNVARLATLRDDDDDGEMIELLMINVHDSVNEGACGRTHRTLSPLRRLDGLLRAALVAAI